MAYTTYRISFKSEEQRAAAAPNIVELQFLTDADAIQFGHNVEQLGEVQLVSVDKLISSNYTLPYPAGNNNMTRSAITDGGVNWMQMRIYDTPAAFAPITRAAALLATGFKMFNATRTAFYVPVSINVQPFSPGASH